MTTTEQKRPYAETIPADVYAKIRTKRVLDVGWRGGPAFIFGAYHPYDPPITLEEAVASLTPAREHMSKAAIFFEDRTTLWLTPWEFSRYDEVPKPEAPRATTTIATTDGPVQIDLGAPEPAAGTKRQATGTKKRASATTKQATATKKPATARKKRRAGSGPTRAK